jgi:heterodisulfide reductase subunit A
VALAARGKVSISPTTSWINPDVCVGCKVCVGLCPYSAIEFDERRQVAVINEAMCKGCGSCAGYCPSGAAQIKHFNENQIFNEIDGLLGMMEDIPPDIGRAGAMPDDPSVATQPGPSA